MVEIENTKSTTKYLNNKFNSSRKNLPCRFMNHTLDNPIKELGYVIELYDENDTDEVPTNEVYETESVVNPAQSISASGSSSSCSVNMSGNLGGNTSTITRSRKVRPKLHKAIVLSREGKLIYGVDALSIIVIGEDLNLS